MNKTEKTAKILSYWKDLFDKHLKNNLNKLDKNISNQKKNI